MTKHTLVVLLSSLALLSLSACRSSSPPPAQTSGGGYSAAAKQGVDVDKMMAQGTVDLWVSPPTYFQEQAFYGVYRGPRPGDYSGVALSSRGSFSKISRRSEYDTAMVTFFAITPDGEEEIFKQTPYQIVEFELLTAKTTPTNASPSPSTERAPKEITAPPTSTPPAEATQHPPVHIHVHTTPPTPQPQPAIDEDAPTFIAPQHGGRVAQRMGYWEVSNLERDLALACVVLRERIKDEDGEPAWKYHGEVWIRDLKSGEVFRHRDENLEPSSWQLHPGPKPQVEVVMADTKGWNRRVDIIDLNALTARKLTARDKANVKPVSK